MTSQVGEMSTATTTVDPVGAVRSLTELIRAECDDMDTTRPRAHPGHPCPSACRRLPADGARGDRRPRDRPGDVPPRRRSGVVRRRLRRMVRHDRRLLRHLRRDAARLRAHATSTATRHHLCRRIPSRWRGRRGRRRLPGHRTVAIGQRVEPRQLVCRRLRRRQGRRAGHRSDRCSVGAGGFLPRRGHRDHRHLGLDRTPGHGQSRLRGIRCVRPLVAHDVVPGAAGQ